MPEKPFYVYALKDPRTAPARPFYIGKGTGSRVYEHEREQGESEKNQVIADIRSAGLQVLHVMLVTNLSENEAYAVEAELIAAFGVREHGGLLVNRVAPTGKRVERPKINVPDGAYERAQLGLAMVKSAVLELARANANGITNADVAKYLGLQSEYGTGSKDYLGYSVLGLLMKEGEMKRVEGKRHIALLK